VSDRKTARTRVLIAGPDPFGYGGVGAVGRALLGSEVLKSRCELIYLTSWKGGPPWRKLWTFFRVLPAFIRRVQFGRVDIVHLHVAHGASLFRKALLAFIAARRQTPYVVQLHSGLIERTAARNALQCWVVRRLFDAASAVIILYEGARDRTERLTGNPNITVLPNPIPPELQEGIVTRTSESLSDRAERVRFLFLGDVVAEKGLVDLLHALTVLRACCSVPIHLDVCGRGEIGRMERLSHQLHLADVVAFHGWVGGRKKSDLLLNADIYVHPSHGEELPMAVVEAAAAGLPIVATRVGGIGDAVTAGENGILVSPKRPDELAQALLRLADSLELRQRMGRRSRELACGRFGIERVAERLLTIWRSCLSTGAIPDGE
jgi:glycosyltransferase involved in cell wall biosynthesis